MTLVHQVSLQILGVENDELLVSCAGSVVTDFFDNFLQCFNTILILGNSIISSSLSSLEEAHLTSMGTQRRQMTDLVGNLPHLAIFVHLLLDGVYNTLDLFLKCLNVLGAADLVIVLVVT